MQAKDFPARAILDFDFVQPFFVCALVESDISTKDEIKTIRRLSRLIEARWWIE